MKKTILIAYSLLIVISSSAQFSFGFKAAAGASNTPYEGLDYKMRPSLAAGGYLKYQHNKIYFQSEFMWTLKGYKYTTVGNDTEHTSYHYLNMPLLAGFLVGNTFSIEIGPEFGYLLNGEGAKMQDRETKKYDLGAAAGFALRLTDKVNIGARYVQGLIKVDRLVIGGMPPVTEPETRELGKNQSFHLSLSMTIN